ncbi:MAG: DUF424 family protein [Nanoarchaeota archaeon]|nr:DUF424 family protein [Nanoarchaeota archaeon]
MDIYVKVHSVGERYSNRFVVALCDKELIGKTLKSGKLHLEVTERFYKGDLRSESEILSIFKDVSNLNILGKRAVALALKAGVITKDHVMMIGKVPHAQATSL